MLSRLPFRNPWPYYQHISRVVRRNFSEDLTQDWINVQRGKFAVLSDADVTFFESVIGSKHLITENDELQSYNVDFLGHIKGDSRLVLKPDSVEEISAILSYCNDKRIAVCPQGGNTGLVCGSVPIYDEVILSLERLNKMISIDELTGIAKCEAGCILHNLANNAEDAGLVVPLDLGAKETCHIGGNFSTNAGGLRVVRYGNLHGSCLGLEVVLANGKVLDLMSDFKKDNTGYHLKHMFIGAEGTLGIITKVAILCSPKSKSMHVAFVGVSSFEDVLSTFAAARKDLGEILSSCEMMDITSMEAVSDHFHLKTPIDEYPFYMLIETSGSNGEHDEEKFNHFLERGMKKGYICDGILTGDPSKIHEIWKLREWAPLAIIKDGYCFKYDLSIPLRHFYDPILALRKRLGHSAHRIAGYGHLGDSNLHISASCLKYTKEIHDAIEPFIYQYTSQLKGSISAEHGIGFLKTKYLGLSKSKEAIDLMKRLKSLLDPNGILNPYKVLA